MVATVGSISIDLSTNAGAFETSFRSAATTVEQQSARMVASIAAVEEKTALAGDKFKEFGVGFAAGTGLAAVFSLESAFEKLKSTLEEYHQIELQAKTSGLQADTYQALAFAAKEAGIDQESLNSALSIFAKNSGLAEHGTGALYASLKKLNPELLQHIINTKDQEERLKLVADAMARTTDASQKAALSAIAFGKGGVEMGRLLDQGRASIEEFKKSALALGIIIPDDLLKRAEELKGQLEILGKVIDVNVGEAIIRLGPELVSLTNGFAGFSKELNEFSTLVNNFTSNPDLENLLKLLNGGAAGGGLIDHTIDKLSLKLNSDDVAAVKANIDFMEKKLSDLRSQAAQGGDFHIEIGEAVQSINDLKAKLGEVQEIVGPIAKSISTDFAQAFRDAENASMDALANMKAGAAAILPTVFRYGGDPSKIELPQFNSQSNVNGSGVGVTSYGAGDPSLGGAGPQSNVNGSGVNVRSYGGPDPNARATAGNTQLTAGNVSKLDANTKQYLQSLSSDIGGYSQQQMSQQTVAISKLSEVSAWMKLSTYALAALVHNNDSGATGTGATMFGNAFDPSVGSYISSWGIGTVKRPVLQLGAQDTGVKPATVGNITVGDININGVTDGAQAGRQAAYEFVRTVYGAMSGLVV